MKKLIGYVNTKDLIRMREADICALDVINIAFGHVKEHEVVWEDAAYALEGMERVRSIKADIKIVLSVGGWSADGFSQAARTQETRAVFAKSAVSLIQAYNLDGIDIDWEYPTSSLAGIASHPSDRENYTLLAKAIRGELDALARPCLLTIAAGGDTYFTRQTQMKELAEYLDYVQLMTYDLQGGFQKATGHHAALYHSRENLLDACVDKAVGAFEAAGVPPEKLIVGVPFYSRKWDELTYCEGTGLGVEAGTVGGYGPDYGKLAEEFIDKNGYTRHWDAEAGVPYLYNGSTFISYEDEQSLTEKIAYVNKMGLGGIMFWEYKCDSTGTLIPLIDRELKGKERK